MKRALVLLLILPLLIVTSGCSFLKRPKNTFYSLRNLPGTQVAKTGVPVGISGLELPPGIDRRGIFLRGESGKVEVRGTDQWTAPLEEMVLHTLAVDLANRLPEGMVVLPGQGKPAAMRTVFVTFAELAAGPSPVFVLDAHWTLDGQAKHERIEVPMASTDSPAVVAAMEQALATFSDRIAAAL
jgi:uncharacterized lipoprotein YmbA